MIIVHDCDSQHALNRQLSRQFEHTTKQWIEGVCNVVLFVANLLIANFYLNVWIRLENII